MTRGRATILFAVALLVLLLFQFRHLLAPGHSLYLSLVDDPGAWWSWYPWDVFSARSFRAGEFPLWNPLSGTGFPHLANFASNAFSPLKWPFYLFPHYRLLDAMVLARVFFLGLFTFLFLGRLGLRHQSAAAGGIALALSGYVMENVNIFNLATEMWLPAGLYLLHGQIQDRPTLRRFLLLGLVSALALAGGNPEAAFYYILFLILYSLFSIRGAIDFRGAADRSAVFDPEAQTRRELTAESLSRAIPKKLMLVLAPIFLAGLFILAQGLPLIEYLGQGWHIHTGRLHALAPFNLRHYWSLLMPWLIGPNHSSEQQLLMLPYLGIVTIGLALIAFAHLRYSASTQGALGARLTPAARSAQPLLFFLIYPLWFLGLIYNLPVIRWLGEIPPFRESGNFKFAMFGITLCLAAAAAKGLDRLLSGQVERRRLTVGLALTVILAFFGIALARHDPQLPPVILAGWFSPLILLVALAALVLRLRHRPSPWLGLTALALVLLDLLLLYPGLGAEGAIDPAAVAVSDPAAPAYLEPIQRDPGHYRFTGQGRVVHHSLNILYGVNDLRAFEALYPRDYVKAFARIEGFDMAQAVEQFFRHGWSFDVRPENLNRPLVSFLGVKYFLTSNPTDIPGWQLFSQDQISTYLNPHVFPRAFLWPEDSLPELGARLTSAAPAAILNYRAQKVVLEAESASPAWLVLTDTYFPGWQAQVNGEEVKIEKVAELVRAVKIPAGRFHLEMIYRPWGFRMGLWGSLMSLGILAVIAIFKSPRRRPPLRCGSHPLLDCPVGNSPLYRSDWRSLAPVQRQPPRPDLV